MTTGEPFCVWFGAIVRDIYSPAVRTYTDMLLDRVVPLFDDPDAEQERIGQETMRALSSYYEDEAAAAEIAYERAIDGALMFMEMRGVFLTMGTAGLFHLFERQLYKFLNHELERFGDSQRVKIWRDAEQIVNELSVSRCRGQTLQAAFNDPDLQELRNAANAVKHGDGPALKALRASSAVIVSPDRVQHDYAANEMSALGVAISIQPDDVKRYRDSILRFWSLDGTFAVAPNA